MAGPAAGPRAAITLSVIVSEAV